MSSSASLTGPPAARNRYVWLKHSFGSVVAAAMVLSVAAHYLFLSSAGFDVLPDYRIHAGPDLEQVALERTIDLPPPPEQIARPAVPVLSTDLEVDPDVTIASTLFIDNPPSDLPPPPKPEIADVSAQPVFTPYEVRPELSNRDDYQRALVRGYPVKLRDAGIGGTVVLWVFIDEQGAVQNTRVTQGSGYQDLDDFAESVLREVARFTPAYNRDRAVPVWIQIPVAFASVLAH